MPVLLSREEELRHVAARTRRGKNTLSAHPEASIAALRAGHPMRHLPGYFGKVVEGLRLAEWRAY
jgi:hypothetical protein